MTSTVVIKFPNGLNYIEYDQQTKKFIKKENINLWLNSILNEMSSLFNHIFYNDDPPNQTHPPSSKYGHCKGIVKWNNEFILWVRHSVPEFPNYATNFNISEKQLIYGQSFHCVKLSYTDERLHQILEDLKCMNAYVYCESLTYKIKPTKQIFKFYIWLINRKYETKTYSLNPISPFEKIRTTVLCKNPQILSIVKPPQRNTDIYKEVLEMHGFSNCKVETWRRGIKYTEPEPTPEQPLRWWRRFGCCCWTHPTYSSSSSVKIVDITLLSFDQEKYRTVKKEINHVCWKNTQDHSKWAIYDNEYFAFGDLNRMTTQYKRGGGMFLCKEPDICKALLQLIIV
jgi:hypothetical protein